MDRRVRLGIVGCGWVVEDFHLPALALVPNLQLAALADVRIERVGYLATQYQVPFVTEDYSDLFDQVDAVLVALPPALHAPVSIGFLKRGIHVLCEKPMATRVWEGEAMHEAARRSGATLAVGLVRRFFDTNRFVKRGVEAGLFGTVQRFEAEESIPFDEMDLSASYVRRDQPGTGVLFDTGVHILDLLLWWFGAARNVAYWDDNRGGVEANCRLEVEMESGVSGSVELSRMRRLRNVIRIYTQDMQLEVPTFGLHELLVHDNHLGLNLRVTAQGHRTSPVTDDWREPFARQLSNFTEAILGEGEPVVSGETGLRSLALIERCHAVRQPLQVADWERFQAEAAS